MPQDEERKTKEMHSFIHACIQMTIARENKATKAISKILEIQISKNNSFLRFFFFFFFQRYHVIKLVGGA